ncbi:MAG: hypothetical protein NVSMB23_15860 [Myxococcales bacterium]
MVAQCPSCQSKFRIADDKVTERGVRVRCSSCKTVFQVRKSGADEPGEAAPDAASPTLDLQGFETGRIPTGKVKVPAGGQARKPTTAPLAGPGATPGKTESAAARLDADDLFGMDELLGEASTRPGSPVSGKPPAPAGRRSAPPPATSARPGGAVRSTPAAKTAAAPAASETVEERSPESFSFEDIDLETPPAPPEAPAPQRSARSGRSGGTSRPPPADTSPDATPTADDAPARDDAPSTGAGPTKDAFGDLELDRPAADSSLELSESGVPAAGVGGERSAGPAAEARADPRDSAPPRPRPASRPRPAAAGTDAPAARTARGDLASSALTGAIGAAVALAVLLAVAAANGKAGLDRLASAGDDVVATRLVSGLYETASGRPVFFVRGQVENHGKVARGPVRVVAELVAENGAPAARAETFPGTLPSPESVYGLRDAAEIEQLARSLASGQPRRPLAAGGTLPFFALVPEPPPDLRRHALRVRVEPGDAAASPPKTALKPPK